MEDNSGVVSSKRILIRANLTHPLVYANSHSPHVAFSMRILIRINLTSFMFANDHSQENVAAVITMTGEEKFTGKQGAVSGIESEEGKETARNMHPRLTEHAQ